ncbi:hypothetical protein [Vibrio tritonius]|uniref:hypothetical protein n=1 Tax=Vibrio tritonius TaxID=1435069 RepID=UPI0008385EC5|nr:hypothetical protein [Vibrio tritonius]
MRFLIFFVVAIMSQKIYANGVDIQSKCSDYDGSYSANFENGFFLECVDNSTMQSNKFVIKDNNGIDYQIDDAAKIVINDQILAAKTEGVINYLISSTKDCKNTTYQRDYYYVYSRIPNGNGYCYALDGKFRKLEHINITGYLNLQISAKIKNNKEYLYNRENGIFIKSGMYLINGDSVIINEEVGDWLNITFSGKKTITSWIHKTAIKLGN